MQWMSDTRPLDDRDAVLQRTPIGFDASVWELLAPLPVSGLSAFVLDADLQPVPIGVVGELYLAGAGLARGYLGHPGLTAQAFVPCPFADEPGARLYRTGDLASYGADGALRFHGRTDDQVKIRGVRIEPGEVEAALMRHPSVQSCAVLDAEDGPDDRTLVAYVSSPATVTVDDLRGFLGTILPHHLIPSAFVRIERPPLSANGKVDRRSLAALRDSGPVLARAFEPPATAIDAHHGEIWQSVLHVEEIGVNDDFFALGGHSLLVGKVISRLPDAFGVELPVSDLFSHPTIRGLGHRIEEALISVGLASANSGSVEVDGLQDLLETIEDMSDEEVDALLERPGMAFE